MSGHGPLSKKRVVVCRGVYCNEGRRADKNLAQLEPAIDSLNGDAYPKPIKVEIANCLSMCGAGPNMIIYPGGVACNHVSPDQLDALIAQHLRD